MTFHAKECVIIVGIETETQLLLIKHNKIARQSLMEIQYVFKFYEYNHNNTFYNKLKSLEITRTHFRTLVVLPSERPAK